MSPSPDSAGIRVGFLPALERSAGGVFQYSATMMDALASIAKQDRKLELVILLPDGASGSRAALEAAGWRVVPAVQPAGFARRVARRLFGRRRARRAWWRRNGIDFAIFPQPHPWAFETGVPSISAIHDIEHRVHPEFPEVSADGEWDRREYVLGNCARSSVAVLVDSDVGKGQLIEFYGGEGFDAARVHVLPFVPASSLPRDQPPSVSAAARERLGVRGEYIFYPAQFWPHKNHVRIVEALALLKSRDGLEVNAVFCGSHGDPVRERNFKSLMESADAHGVAGQLRVLGFVSDDDLAALYSGARALVMPTYFGPTNIPLLEAWALGCPVVTSDIPGVREQMGDAALLADPRSTDEFATAIKRVWTDAALRATLVARGTARLASYGPAEFRERLRGALDFAVAAVR